jgi:hypothetical protein
LDNVFTEYFIIPFLFLIPFNDSGIIGADTSKSVIKDIAVTLPNLFKKGDDDRER